jgi:hypothetical protein
MLIWGGLDRNGTVLRDTWSWSVPQSARDRFLQIHNLRRVFLLYRDVYLYLAYTPLSPQSLIEQILQIQQMEHGSLSIIRQGPNGPYYNLNSWENGKNCCRYLPQDKLPEVQKAIEGYHRYQQLTEQYAQQVVDQTRAQLKIGVKKKPQPNPKSPRPKSASPRSRKSNT